MAFIHAPAANDPAVSMTNHEPMVIMMMRCTSAGCSSASASVSSQMTIAQLLITPPRIAASRCPSSVNSAPKPKVKAQAAFSWMTGDEIPALVVRSAVAVMSPIKEHRGNRRNYLPGKRPATPPLWPFAGRRATSAVLTPKSRHDARAVGQGRKICRPLAQLLNFLRDRNGVGIETPNSVFDLVNPVTD